MLYKDEQKKTLEQGKSKGKDAASKDMSMICLKYDPDGKKETVQKEANYLRLIYKQNQQILYRHNMYMSIILYGCIIYHMCIIHTRTHTHTYKQYCQASCLQ